MISDEPAITYIKGSSPALYAVETYLALRSLGVVFTVMDIDVDSSITTSACSEILNRLRKLELIEPLGLMQYGPRSRVMRYRLLAHFRVGDAPDIERKLFTPGIPVGGVWADLLRTPLAVPAHAAFVRTIRERM